MPRKEKVQPVMRYERIPLCTASPEEIAKQMRINADIIMKEISDHVDKELDRFKLYVGTLPDCISDTYLKSTQYPEG